MDPAAKRATRDRIAALRAAGTTVLLTTHELDDVERLADRVAIIDRGRIVAAGTPAELTGGGAPRLRFRVSRRLEDAERADLAAVVGRLGGGTPAVTRRRRRGGLRRRRPGRPAGSAPRRRARRVVRDARTAAHRAPRRGREPRGAVSRARRRGGGLVIGAGAPARPAPWPAMAAALAANELRLALRRGEGLLITFVIPVGVLLVFSALDTGGATARRRPPAPGRDRARRHRRRLRVARHHDRVRAPVRRDQAPRREPGGLVRVSSRPRRRPSSSSSSSSSSCSSASRPARSAGPPGRRPPRR